ncbi:MAG: hypothetical protein HXS44_16050 [Theionarchaea archaeon]|nr:hypothetical protein [Theionarchaea archaeon]
MKNINLKELERKAFASYFEDGLWDIFLGIFMAGMGIRSLTDNVVFTLLAMAGIPILFLGKKAITLPRIGYVKFSQTRKDKQMKVMWILIVSVIATLLLLSLIVSRQSPSVLIATLMGISFAGVLCVIAYYMDFRRLYLYGILFGITVWLTEVFGSPAGPLASTISGGIALSIGLIQFIRFLHKYPNLEESTDDQF